MSNIKDLATSYQPNWCPGCGDFGIWAGIKNAVIQMGWTPADFVAVYGVGCHGHMVNFMKSYAFEGLHGRPLPVAEGIRLANHKLPVLVIAGDGDTFGEGTNHFVHAARRNIDLTMILHDNQVYGLTTGQTAPTAKKGFKTKSTPRGVLEDPVNPIALALAAGATFVARGFASDIPAITRLIVAAIKHNGFALVDIFQPCVTFNHINTYQWYREHIYDLPPDFDTSNRALAFEKSLEWTDKIPVGIFYQEEKPTYEEQTPQIKDKSLVEADMPTKENLSRLFEEFI